MRIDQFTVDDDGGLSAGVVATLVEPARLRAGQTVQVTVVREAGPVSIAITAVPDDSQGAAELP